MQFVIIKAKVELVVTAIKIILVELIMVFLIRYYWAKIEDLLIINFKLITTITILKKMQFEFIFMLSFGIQITFIVIILLKKINHIIN